MHRAGVSGAQPQCGENARPDSSSYANTFGMQCHPAEQVVRHRMPRLTHLRCDDVKIPELDLSRCTALRALMCRETNIGTLNLEACLELQHLSTNRNRQLPHWTLRGRRT